MTREPSATPTSPPMSTPMRNRAGCAAHSRTIGPGEKTSRRMKRIRTSNFAALPCFVGKRVRGGEDGRHARTLARLRGGPHRGADCPGWTPPARRTAGQRLTRRSRPSSRRGRADGGRGIHTSDAPLRTVMPETGTRRAPLAPGTSNI
jgi:hypothetical protein